MIICLEGLIGAGKSTIGRSLVTVLESHGYEAKYYPEYVNQPLLNQYIENMNRYAYPFQVIMLHQRFACYREACHFIQGNDRKVAIIDRGFDGDYAFAYMQYQDGNISPAEWSVYQQIVAEQQAMLSWSQITIYLKCNVDTCLQRIKCRSRDGETAYTRDYLLRLESAYLASLRRTPHLVVDNDDELTNSFLSGIINTIERDGLTMLQTVY